MKSWIFVIFSFSSFVGAQPFEREATDELLVKHRKGDGKDNERAALHRQHGASEKHRFKHIPWSVIELPKNANHFSIRETYRKSGLFEVVQNNNVYRVEPLRNLQASLSLTPQATPNDPLLSQQWGPQKIQATLAWDKFTGARGTSIWAVVDTGIDWRHPDLTNNMWTAADGVTHGYTCIGGIVSPGGLDDHSHGTHVAGIIGAEANNAIGIAGLNWHCQLIAIKFLTAGGSGSTADAILGLGVLIEMIKQGVPIKGVNCSWGALGYDAALYDAFAKLQEYDVISICAAGNNGINTDQQPFSPASYSLEGIVSVLASDQQDNRAGFSNFGASTTDILAPGVYIVSTVPGNSYQPFSGTSMAAPHVSGVVLAMRGINPALTYWQARTILLDPSSYDKTSFPTCSTGGGRVNFYKTITNPLIGHPPINTNQPPTLTLNYTNNPLVVAPGTKVDIIATTSDPNGDPVTVAGSMACEQDVFPYAPPSYLFGNDYRTNTVGNVITIDAVRCAFDTSPVVGMSASDGHGGGVFKSLTAFVYRDPSVRRNLTNAIVNFNISFEQLAEDGSGVIHNRVDLDPKWPADEFQYGVVVFRKDLDFAQTCCFAVNSDQSWSARLEPNGVNTARIQLLDKWGNYAQGPQRLIRLGNTDGANPPNLDVVFNQTRGPIPFTLITDASRSQNIPYGTRFTVGTWGGFGASGDALNPIQQGRFGALGTYWVYLWAINQSNHTGDQVIYPITGLPMDSTEPPSTNPPPPSLVAPNDLKATLVDSGITLTWTDRATGEQRYEVQDSIKAKGPGGSWQTVATLPANSQTYKLLNPQKAVYQFRVRACASSCGFWSNGVEIRNR